MRMSAPAYLRAQTETNRADERYKLLDIDKSAGYFSDFEFTTDNGSGKGNYAITIDSPCSQDSP